MTDKQNITLRIRVTPDGGRNRVSVAHEGELLADMSMGAVPIDLMFKNPLLVELALSDDDLEELAIKCAAAANHGNDNEWFSEAEDIAHVAARTALHRLREIIVRKNT